MESAMASEHGIDNAATPKEIEIMRHALGATRPGREGGWRNYYCAEASDKKLSSMAKRGLMKRGQSINEGRDIYYHVPEEWCRALGITVTK